MVRLIQLQLTEIICILTEDVSRVIKPNGYFITSGIIHDRVEMVTNKLEECGFEVVKVNKDGEWNCIIAKLKQLRREVYA